MQLAPCRYAQSRTDKSYRVLQQCCTHNAHYILCRQLTARCSLTSSIPSLLRHINQPYCITASPPRLRDTHESAVLLFHAPRPLYFLQHQAPPIRCPEHDSHTRHAASPCCTLTCSPANSFRCRGSGLLARLPWMQRLANHCLGVRSRRTRYSSHERRPDMPRGRCSPHRTWLYCIS